MFITFWLPKDLIMTKNEKKQGSTGQHLKACLKGYPTATSVMSGNMRCMYQVGRFVCLPCILWNDGSHMWQLYQKDNSKKNRFNKSFALNIDGHPRYLAPNSSRKNWCLAFQPAPRFGFSVHITSSQQLKCHALLVAEGTISLEGQHLTMQLLASVELWLGGSWGASYGSVVSYLL